MSQREIAAHSNRSQPEIRRLLQFHGTSPHARRLRARRDELVGLLAAHGLRNVRVFGSTASGRDTEDSDIDLLVTAEAPLGLLAQAPRHPNSWGCLSTWCLTTRSAPISASASWARRSPCEPFRE